MIDIIIPAYNAHKTLEKALLSICSQNIDQQLNVYVCNDGSKKDYKDIIKKFKTFINIKELTIDKNSGPGVARQVGLDKSNSEYVVFLDADDELYSSISLKLMYNKIKENDSDMVIASFIEETDQGDYLHSDDYVWLHGKMYKREFIDKCKVKFNDSYANEDNYFNKSLLIRNPKIDYLDDTVYVWKNNKTSITRKNNREYNTEGLLGFIDNMTQVSKEAIDDNVNIENVAEFSFSFFYAVYFYYILYYDNKIASELINRSYDLRNIYLELSGKYKEIADDIYINQFNHFNTTFEDIRIMRPVITFNEFLDLYK
ncbi:MAG: glycosyltransferase family 2 protein [Bacilli bacterium]|nr:glycosyltransferase family 2 protein [Bacilli bacterium]